MRNTMNEAETEGRSVTVALPTWQPIETAPKPNVDVLLWYPWSGGAWEEAPAGFIYIARWVISREDNEDGWRDPVDFESVGAGATHWMPLPAPPRSGGRVA